MDPLTEYRKQKDRYFEFDPHSPLSESQIESFQGLKYFPENQQLRMEVELSPFPEQKWITLQTSTGDSKVYLRYGSFSFDVEGQTAALTVYKGEDGEAFVPFWDATSGSETYGAGRYLELVNLGGERYLADFNLAYNPWCAYSPDYSCPIPPRENRLAVPIQAGEKNFP